MEMFRRGLSTMIKTEENIPQIKKKTLKKTTPPPNYLSIKMAPYCKIDIYQEFLSNILKFFKLVANHVKVQIF